MNILNKIFFIVLTPTFIHAQVQRAPGQPLAKPGKSIKKTENISQYVVTIRKNFDAQSAHDTAEYDINIKPVIGGSKDAKEVFKKIASKVSGSYDNNAIELSTHEPVNEEERIPFGGWRD